MISGRDLLRGINYIDDDIVDESDEDKEMGKDGVLNLAEIKNKKRRTLSGWMAAAACLVLAVGVGTFAFKLTNKTDRDDIVDSDITDSTANAGYKVTSENNQDILVEEQEDNSNSGNDSNSMQENFNYGTDSLDSVDSNVKLPDGIVLISRYTNEAWGHDDRGSFIDGGGNVYDFDFSSGIYGDEDEIDIDIEEFIYRLEQIRQTQTPQSSVDIDLLTKCYEYISKVDWSAQVIEESVACDAGQTTLYYFDGDSGNMKLLSSNGDIEKYLDDDAAKQAVKLYEKMTEMED